MKIFKLTDLLENKLSPEKRAEIYDKMNKRCLELGLTSPEHATQQACQYKNGYPA